MTFPGECFRRCEIVAVKEPGTDDSDRLCLDSAGLQIAIRQKQIINDISTRSRLS